MGETRWGATLWFCSLSSGGLPSCSSGARGGAMLWALTSSLKPSSVPHPSCRLQIQFSMCSPITFLGFCFFHFCLFVRLFVFFFEQPLTLSFRLRCCVRNPMDLLVGLHIAVCTQWVACVCSEDVLGAHAA